MNFEIAVQKIPARLVTRNGVSTDVVVYLHQVSARAPRQESIADRLNDPDARFLPCEIAGVTWLVALDSIAFLELGNPPPDAIDPNDALDHRTAVELHLDNGERLRGDLLYNPKSSASRRVSDYLNSGDHRFLRLACGSLTLFVNQEAVARVRV